LSRLIRILIWIKLRRRWRSISVIIRDSKGEVLVTLTEPQDNIIAPDVAKSTTILKAINFSCVLGFFKIIFEGTVMPSKYCKCWEKVTVIGVYILPSY
jgi:hypothetical protein